MISNDLFCAVLMRSAIKRMTDYKGKNITIPLSDHALKWLPEREGCLPESRIFYKLPDHANIRTTQV